MLHTTPLLCLFSICTRGVDDNSNVYKKINADMMFKIDTWYMVILCK